MAAFFHSNNIFGKKLRKKKTSAAGFFGFNHLSSETRAAMTSDCCATPSCCPTNMAAYGKPVFNALGYFFKRPTSTGFYNHLGAFK